LGVGVQNSLLRHVHVTLELRHPWLRTVLDTHSQRPPRTLCRGKQVQPVSALRTFGKTFFKQARTDLKRWSVTAFQKCAEPGMAEPKRTRTCSQRFLKGRYRPTPPRANRPGH
ncbi:unnamed protein product, partial [Ectocarpus sp. 8 AP-2014]